LGIEKPDRGELVLGGALANPVDGAVLLFKGDSPEIAESFAKVDPYVTSGLVKRWYVREWTTVAGNESAIPIKPDAAAASGASATSATEGGNRSPSSLSSAIHPPQQQLPILRLWKARSTVPKASAYVRHASEKVFPKLRGIPGHRGAYLLRRAVDGAMEFVVMTLWDSMDAVRRFAGAQPDKAVIEPEARAVLTSCDESVTHFEVVDGMENAKAS